MTRVGIIGTGLVAREHAQAIAMIPGRAILIAAADLEPGRLQEFCAAFRVPRGYGDAQDLIADPSVDLVAITVPPAAHEALAIAALERGKHVFCEKPLAHSFASAVRIAEVAGRHPRRMAVSYQLRYEPSFRRLIWLCRNGWIGEIQSALIERHSYIPHPDSGKKGWWGSWNVAGGGVLITQLIHELDVLQLVMGRPLAVSAQMDTRHTEIESEDHVEAVFTFADGHAARCVATVNSGRSGGAFSIRGSAGSVSIPWEMTMNDPDRLTAAMSALNAAIPVAKPPSMSFLHRGIRRIKRGLGIKADPELTPHARLYLEIARSIADRASLPIPPTEALDSLEMCMAAYESAITGRDIRLPLDLEALVYHGVTNESYAARKCARNGKVESGSVQ